MARTNYFDQHPQDITRERRAAFEGDRVPGVGYVERSGKNGSGIAAHIVDLTPTSYAGSETYSFTIESDSQSHDFSFTAAAGDNTVAEVIDAAIVAIEDESGGVLNIAYPTDQTTTLRLTSYTSGADAAFTLSSLSSNWTQATTQSAADASNIPWGRAVIRVAKPSPGGVFSALQWTGHGTEWFALPSSTTLPAMSRTFVASGTYTSGDIFSATGAIHWGDQIIPIAIPFGIGQTAVDAAFADLVTHLNAQHGSYLTAAYTSGTNTLVVTSDFYGMYFDLQVQCTTAGHSNTITATSANTTKVLKDLFLGGTIRIERNSGTDIDSYFTGIEAGDSGAFVVNGGLWVVPVGTAPTVGETVYVCSGSGEQGKFSGVAAAHRVPLPKSIAVWAAVDGDMAQVMFRKA